MVKAKEVDSSVIMRILNWVGRNWKIIIILIFTVGTVMSGCSFKCKYGEVSKSSIDIPVRK